jgi:hypothetical protein
MNPTTEPVGNTFYSPMILVDPKRPDLKNSISLNHTSFDRLLTDNLFATRYEVSSRTEAIVKTVKVGATLTVIGNVVYDLETD